MVPCVLPCVSCVQEWATVVGVADRVHVYLTFVSCGQTRLCLRLRLRLCACVRGRSHLCLVFELLGSNLYETVKATHFRGLDMVQIQAIAAQLLAGLQLLYSQSIVHCDLKPENVLMNCRRDNGIKLIDLGSSCFQGSTMYSYVVLASSSSSRPASIFPLLDYLHFVTCSPL